MAIACAVSAYSAGIASAHNEIISGLLIILGAIFGIMAIYIEWFHGVKKHEELKKLGLSNVSRRKKN